MLRLIFGQSILRYTSCCRALLRACPLQLLEQLAHAVLGAHAHLAGCSDRPASVATRCRDKFGWAPSRISAGRPAPLGTCLSSSPHAFGAAWAPVAMDRRAMQVVSDFSS